MIGSPAQQEVTKKYGITNQQHISLRRLGNHRLDFSPADLRLDERVGRELEL